MDSVARNAKRSAAAVALGLGLTVAAGPGLAWAEDAESPATESPAGAKTGTARTGAEETSTGKPAAQKPRRSAAEPRVRPRRTPDAVAVPRPAAADRQRPAASDRPAGSPAESGPDLGLNSRPPVPSAAISAPSPSSAVVPTSSPVPAAPMTGSTIPAGAPALTLPTPRVTVAAVAKPAAVMTAASTLTSSTTGTPAGATTGAAFNPFDVLTAALAMISREINRLFFNRTPTAKPVLHSLSNGPVVTGTIGGSDPDDDPLAYSVTDQPNHGTVAVDPVGTFTYTADPELAAAGGTDTFVVEVRDTGFHLNFWVPTAISVPVTVTVQAAAPDPVEPDPVLPPSLTIADRSVAEGDGGHSHFMFTVNLDTASAAPVSVQYATTDGTAVAGLDYTAAAGTLTFAPGVTTQLAHVDILGDLTVEADETFTVTLSNPIGATILDGSARGTILDDDDAAPLTPGLSISDASVTESSGGGMAPGFLSTSGNQIIDSAGNPVQLSGVNWFGMESTTGAPHGLWTRSYTDMIDQMAAEGFNTIRLPYASEALHTTAAPNGIDFSKNPELQGLTSLQIMDAVIDYAGQQGMRVILDHHRSGYGTGTSGNGLWYEGQYTEDAWVADWQMLAERYSDDPTVIGMDLHNEPHNGTWGGGGATDWARAAERAGNAVLAVNPDLLIFVEGVGTYQGQSYWWGGNLMGVADRPITLDVPNRVVYSPHDYPNSVYAQPWFSGPDFGAALPAKFRQMWGYIYEEGIAPVYIGEFGTNLTDPKDVVWFEAITSYISGDLDNDGTIDIPAGTEDISWTFWSWNPNSGDTGGILADDWLTVNENKMAYLTAIQFAGSDSDAVATFRVSLTSASAQPVTVQYATSNMTASAGSDYTATSGTVTFAPGETEKVIAVLVQRDVLAEGSETFMVMLSNPSGATVTDAMAVGTILDRPVVVAPPVDPVDPVDPVGPDHSDHPVETGDYVDLMTFGMSHGSDHTGMDALVGGRTPITTEAVVAYNDLRRFTGLAPATIEDVGRWAFANGLTNNTQAWGTDVQGVGLFYAMQGAKVGWIADDKYDPQIVADIERTARLGSADDVMAMVAAYGHDGYAEYLLDNGYDTAFINTLKMETHWAGWMHDRAHGRLLIEGGATAHDVNHLTVLSHDQMQPFMNDTWDYPQWPALDVSDARVIEYFQSMVTLGDPLGDHSIGDRRTIAV